MNETLHNLYTTFINSPFFGLSLSIFTYQLGLVLNRKWKHPITHPLLVSIISCCLFLGFTKIPYPQYYIGGSIIATFLGPATAILSVSMYEQLEILKKNILPILVGTIVGSFTAISSIILMGRWFNLDWTIILSLIPKSVTTAIGLSISEAFDGIPAITVAGIIITGNFGALVCPSLAKLFKIKNPVIFAREGLAVVGLGWLAVSLAGALPLYLSREIPTYLDCLFEIVSGFTTTGSSILSDIEALSYANLFWRSFTHWIGGMGVLVFMLAILPKNDRNSMHLMRAEVPGPTVGKIVAKMRFTAQILYAIYIALTAIMVVFLLCGKMPLFDSLVNAFATAGTGGFAIKNASIAAYNSAYIEYVIGIFMMLFGVNFAMYFRIQQVPMAESLKSVE